MYKTELTVFEIFEKSATIIIAASSLFFSYIIYKYQLKKNDTDLKLTWYKTIIVEGKFDSFFTFFDKISGLIKEMANSNDFSLQVRQEINDSILAEFSFFERDFISLLLSVDKMLYECVKKQFDDLIDGITLILANEESNLNTNNEVRKEIERHIDSQKSIILKLFVDFRGNGDSHKTKIQSYKLVIEEKMKKLWTKN